MHFIPILLVFVGIGHGVSSLQHLTTDVEYLPEARSGILHTLPQFLAVQLSKSEAFSRLVLSVVATVCFVNTGPGSSIA